MRNSGEIPVSSDEIPVKLWYRACLKNRKPAKNRTQPPRIINRYNNDNANNMNYMNDINNDYDYNNDNNSSSSNNNNNYDSHSY